MNARMRQIRASSLVKASWFFLPCLLLACAASQMHAPDQLAPVAWTERAISTETRPSDQQYLLASAPIRPGNSGTSHVRRWKQLTAVRLVQLAREKGVGASGSVVERNRQIGRA